MPEGESKTYTSKIVLSGNIDDKLFADIRKLIGHNAVIKRQAEEIGKSSKEGFKLFKEGAEDAKKGVETLKDSLVELLAPILAITGAFSSIEGVFHVLDAASDKFKEVRDSAAAFKATLASTTYLQAHPAELEAQVKYFEEQAQKAVAADQGVFGGHMMEEIQKSLVGTTGLGSLLTEPLLAKIPVVSMELAHGGLESATPEAVNEATNAIALFIKTGVARGPLLRQLLGNIDVKDVKAMNREQRENLLLGTNYFKGANTYLEHLKESNPTQFKLAQEQVKAGAAVKRLGQEWTPVQEQLQIMALQTQASFDDLLTSVLPSITPTIEKALQAISEEEKKLFTKKNIDEFSATIKELADDPNLKAIGEDLKAGFQYVVDHPGEIKSAIKDVFSDLKELVDTLKWLWDQLKKLHPKTEQTIDFNPAHWGDRANKNWKEMFGITLPDLLFNNPGTKDLVDKYKASMPTTPTSRSPESFSTPGYAIPNIAAVYRKELSETAEQQQQQRDSLQDLKDTTDQANNALLGFTQSLQFSISPIGSGNGAGTGSGSGGPLHVGELQTPGISAAGESGAVRATRYGHENRSYAQWYGNHGNYLRVPDIAVNADLAAQMGLRVGQRIGEYQHGKLVYSGIYNDTKGDPGVDNFLGQDFGYVTIKKLAGGGIVNRRVLSWLGEGKDQEAVIPLNRNSIAKAGLGGSHFAPTFAPQIYVNASEPDHIAEQVSAVLERDFERHMSSAFEDYQRLHLN